MIHRILACLVFAAFLSACTSMSKGDPAAASRIVMEEFMVTSTDRGIELYVRNKHPEGMTGVKGDRVLLFVHGATYPSETA